MFKKSLVFGLALLIAVVPFAVTAQDTTGLVPSTLEDLTADPAPYVGQTVILEGYVEDFVNVNTFVLGEAAALDNDQVLVINTSGEALPVNLFNGDSVIVTGIVHPSLQTRIDNGEVVLPEDRVAYRRNWTMGDMTVDPVVTPDTSMEATPEESMEATVDPMVTPDAAATDTMEMDETTDMHMTGETVMMNGWEGFDFYYGGGYPDAYDGFVIIEVTGIQDIVHNVTE